MKKLFSLVAAIMIAATTFAQVDEVTLTVIGTGSTKEQAVSQALRSAIEQSFGTFVSANTSIVNDKLTKDEIVSISSGNIKKYEELSYATLSNGNTMVSLRATVSVKKLTTYAKSHGSKCEFAGNTFAANMKLRELYKRNESQVLDNMLNQLELMLPYMFQYSISVSGEPKEANYGREYNIPATFSVKATENSEAAFDLIFSTLTSLTLNDNERKSYESTNTKIYKLETNYYSHPAIPEMRLDEVLSNQYVTLVINGREVPRSELRREHHKGTFYFRNPFPAERLVNIINRALKFSVLAILNTSRKGCIYKMDNFHNSSSRFYLASLPYGNKYWDGSIDIEFNNIHLWGHLTKSTDTRNQFLISGAINKAKAKKYNKERHFGDILVEKGYIIVPQNIMAQVKGFEIKY